MPTEFRLPELGENVEKGDLVKVLVSVGDVINKDQSVIELETEKATLEVPSGVSGKVRSIHVKEGEQVKVGQLILTVDDGARLPASEASETAQPAATSGAAKAPVEPTQPPEQPAAGPTLVPTAPAPQTPATGTPAEVVPITRAPAAGAPEPVKVEERPLAPAAPSVRRIARELGVDIREVRGSGPGGRVSSEDVKAYVRARSGAAPGAAGGLEPLPDFARWGEVERQAMRAVRRSTAAHLSRAWSIPHVTHHDRADITQLDRLRQQYGPKVEAQGGKLTVTAVALKVVASALRVFPQFAASVDMAREEIVYKKYCHIGVAVDTDRGLLVPVIRDVDRKNIFGLSVELAAVAEKARTRKLAAEDMEGGVFTITNLGGIGGIAFSPIINSPEVAILGISRASLEPVFLDGRFEPRLMLPLSLSYDHRLIDGADAARFLRWVAEALEQPFLVLFQG
jgi:pyruvate dehydrogenase E2 component (dihydrolipoyllysine-residue acetyltransferase)